MDVAAEIERGRAAHAREAWAETYDALSAIADSDAIGPDELELLATAEYLTGREPEYLAALELAYRARLAAGERLAAFRAAFWIGVTLARAGEIGRAGGWLGRAQRLLDQDPNDCVERGYMLLPAVFEHEARGDIDSAAATAAEAVAIAERYGDQNLFALAAHEQGHILIMVGRLREGISLVDEAMVAVTAGEVTAIVAGIVYCGAILACQEANEVRRAGEWTAALTQWCERQPGLVAFTGRCLVHRAEILQLHGSWREALDEARRAASAASRPPTRRRAARRGTAKESSSAFSGSSATRRTRTERRAAVGASRSPASRCCGWPRAGRTPPPAPSGERSRRRPGRGSRAALLPAAVEVMLAAGDPGAARDACLELDELARDDEPARCARSPQARTPRWRSRRRMRARLCRRPATRPRLGGSSRRPTRRPAPACSSRSHAGRWETRTRPGSSSTPLAAPSQRSEPRRSSPASRALAHARARASHGLSPRELEVLRHLASGATNKAIAAELVVSVRTVDRHVSSILAKLGVSSRAAATAYAHEHHVV